MRFRKTALGAIATVSLTIYGLPGMFDDFKAWKGWFEMDIPLPVASVFWVTSIGCTMWMFINKRRTYPAPFDLPIRDAIQHIVDTTDHSYDRLSLAEQEAFCCIHEQIRKGRLPVKGSDSPFKRPERISRRKCRTLVPMSIVVPKSSTAPEGIMFALCRQPIDLGMHGYYRGLRVRSQDLYQIWPKVVGEAK